MDEEQNSAKTQRRSSNLFSELDGLNSRELALAIKKMNMGQKKQLAMKGSPAIRRILLRDPNSEVQLAVVASPKTNESEIESIAKMPATSEIVLKTIFSNSRWFKSYRIKLALTMNPKSPMSVVNRCIRTLTSHDLKKISQNSALRKVVSQAATRLLKTRR